MTYYKPPAVYFAHFVGGAIKKALDNLHRSLKELQSHHCYV